MLEIGKYGDGGGGGESLLHWNCYCCDAATATVAAAVAVVGGVGMLRFDFDCGGGKHFCEEPGWAQRARAQHHV